MNPLPPNWRKIAEQVNAEVNALPYKTDRERYGVAEFWEVADASGGDCEDYALAKLRRLYRAGFPIERLRLATCYVEGEHIPRHLRGHAVLVIDAPDDFYVLDNRFPSGMVTVTALIGRGYELDLIQARGGSRNFIPWEHV